MKKTSVIIAGGGFAGLCTAMYPDFLRHSVGSLAE
jgi:thioredoxin reductase